MATSLNVYQLSHKSSLYFATTFGLTYDRRWTGQGRSAILSPVGLEDLKQLVFLHKLSSLFVPCQDLPLDPLSFLPRIISFNYFELVFTSQQLTTSSPYHKLSTDSKYLINIHLRTIKGSRLFRRHFWREIDSLAASKNRRMGVSRQTKTIAWSGLIVPLKNHGLDWCPLGGVPNRVYHQSHLILSSTHFERKDKLVSWTVTRWTYVPSVMPCGINISCLRLPHTSRRTFGAQNERKSPSIIRICRGVPLQTTRFVPQTSGQDIVHRTLTRIPLLARSVDSFF